VRSSTSYSDAEARATSADPPSDIRLLVSHARKAVTSGSPGALGACEAHGLYRPGARPADPDFHGMNSTPRFTTSSSTTKGLAAMARAELE
jgi:hypothetical protein